MLFTDLINKVNAKVNGEPFDVRYEKDLPLNANAKKNGVVAYKQTTMTLCKGLDYENTEYAKGRTLTHTLPWGKFSKDYENVIEHNGKRYIRFYAPNKNERNQTITKYFVNGVEKTYEELKTLGILVNSFFTKKEDTSRDLQGAPYVIDAENIVEIF